MPERPDRLTRGDAPPDPARRSDDPSWAGPPLPYRFEFELPVECVGTTLHFDGWVSSINRQRVRVEYPRKAEESTVGVWEGEGAGRHAMSLTGGDGELRLGDSRKVMVSFHSGGRPDWFPVHAVRATVVQDSGPGRREVRFCAEDSTSVDFDWDDAILRVWWTVQA